MSVRTFNKVLLIAAVMFTVSAPAGAETVKAKTSGTVIATAAKKEWSVETPSSVSITGFFLRTGERRILKLTAHALVVVKTGSIVCSGGSKSATVSERECLVLQPSPSCVLTAEQDSASIMVLSFGALTGTAACSIPEETPVSLDALQFFKPEGNTDARMVVLPEGQAALLRFDRDADIRPIMITGDACYLVTRGTSTAMVDGKRVPLKKGDLLYCTDCEVSFTTGNRGMDAIALFPGGRTEYTDAFEERMAVFHSVIEPGAKPELLLDGDTIKPGLTFTEGPTWMNGRFYFSNYYKFWKPWGSSEEGGVWMIGPDGSYRILNKNVQTCGTTPLPNGKLAVCDLFGRSVTEMDPETGEMGRVLAGSYEGVPFAVANDVITDRKGGFYVTDSSVAKEGPKQPGTALYYVNTAGEVLRVTEPNAVEYINGVVLSPDDRTLYLDGSGEIYIWAFDVKPDGSLENRRPFAKLYAPDSELDSELPRSVADGMTVDSEGYLYVATPLGVQVFDNRGSFIGIVTFPKGPSHCTFGGADLSSLYVTARTHIYRIRTLRKGLQYPLQ